MVETVLPTELVPAGVATLVFQNDQVLLGKRFEQQQFVGWQCPGGFMRQGEDVLQAATRHCRQKAGIQLGHGTFSAYSNNLFPSDSNIKHSVTLYVLSHQFNIIDTECFEQSSDQWAWFDFDKLPQALFLPLSNLLQAHSLNDLYQCSLNGI